MTVVPHSYPVETFIEAMDRLYEDVLISNTVLVCLNDDAVKEYAEHLHHRQYSVLWWGSTAAPSPLRRGDENDYWLLRAFKDSANTVLVVSLRWLMGVNSVAFAHTLVASGWNALVSVGVPSYHMDALFKRVLDANENGFYGTQEDFHLMWYME